MKLSYFDVPAFDSYSLKFHNMLFFRIKMGDPLPTGLLKQSEIYKEGCIGNKENKEDYNWACRL